MPLGYALVIVKRQLTEWAVSWETLRGAEDILLQLQTAKGNLARFLETRQELLDEDSDEIRRCACP